MTYLGILKKNKWGYELVDALEVERESPNPVVAAEYFPVRRHEATEYRYVLTRDRDLEPTWWLTPVKWGDDEIEFVARSRVREGEVEIVDHV